MKQNKNVDEMSPDTLLKELDSLSNDSENEDRLHSLLDEWGRRVLCGEMK